MNSHSSIQFFPVLVAAVVRRVNSHRAAPEGRRKHRPCEMGRAWQRRLPPTARGRRAVEGNGPTFRIKKCPEKISGHFTHHHQKLERERTTRREKAVRPSSSASKKQR